MKKLLLMAVLVTLSSVCYSKTVYFDQINQVTPFKISSATAQGFNVGSSTVSYTMTDEDKDLLITNLSGSVLLIDFMQSFSTGTFSNGQEVGFPIPSGSTIRLEKFYGTLYMKNDGTTTNEVRTLKVKNVK